MATIPKRDRKMFAVAPFGKSAIDHGGYFVSLQNTLDDAVALKQLYRRLKLKTFVIPVTVHFSQEHGVKKAKRG